MYDRRSSVCIGGPQNRSAEIPRTVWPLIHTDERRSRDSLFDLSSDFMGTTLDTTLDT